MLVGGKRVYIKIYIVNHRETTKTVFFLEFIGYTKEMKQTIQNAQLKTKKLLE